jgi:hypothetical protein
LCRHINPILLSDTSLAPQSFLLATRLVNFKFPFGNLGLLTCDLGTVLCLLVREQDARETLEFGTGYLLLHESATLGAESVRLGAYFSVKQHLDLVDGSLGFSFFPVVFFSLVVAVSKYTSSAASSTIPRISFGCVLSTCE